jgi:hypothetical protein
MDRHGSTEKPLSREWVGAGTFGPLHGATMKSVSRALAVLKVSPRVERDALASIPVQLVQSRRSS